MKNGIFLLSFFFFSLFLHAQDNHHEIGVDIQAASISNRGGAFGGAVKYAYVLSEDIAFGPSFRFQYLWSKDLYYGTQGKSFTWGGGAFFHYRFLQWLYVGAEVEVLKNPFTWVRPDKRWSLTAFVGGGFSHDFGPIRLNFGLLYDIADAVRDPYTSNPSPLSREYFIKVVDPKKPNFGKYVPLIYRLTFFIPIRPKVSAKETDDYE
ncbi:MAG: hypothetical protein M9897_04800 [Brumimicrobium sp.]|nr:hypothetical protein [Brumimicrobium sp.]